MVRDRNSRTLFLLLAGMALLLLLTMVHRGWDVIGSTGGFMPHGHCYLWRPGIVWLHVISDTVIFVAYVAISAILVYFVMKRPDLPFDWMFMAFGVFIVACGIGHLLDVITLWKPIYWLSGLERALTALVSIVTAVVLVPLVPKALALPSPQQLRESNTRLEEALETLRAQQEALLRAEKLAAVGQLAASVGHELRNPLAAVRNASTYLSRRMLAEGEGTPVAQDPRVRQFFELIDREVEASTRIISNLLDFSRDRPPELSPCVVRLLVDEAVELVPGAAQRVDNQVPTDLPLPMLDVGQFRQVMINLLQNALDASPADVALPITVQAEGGDDRPLKLVIKDLGCGIPDEVLPRIFDPLFTTKTKGTGLGLAITRNIVRAHQGEISVTSRVGLGTTFTILLPADRSGAQGEPAAT
jgi:signal transduction histidine kinase